MHLVGRCSAVICCKYAQFYFPLPHSVVGCDLNNVYLVIAVPGSMQDAKDQKWDPASVDEALKLCKQEGLLNKKHTARGLHRAFRKPTEDGKMIAMDAMRFEDSVKTKAAHAKTFFDMTGMFGKTDLDAFHSKDLYVVGGVDCSRIPNVDTFRTSNGTCNNKRFTTWGAREQPFIRLLPPQYGGTGYNDPVEEINGVALPGARTISLELHPDVAANDNDHSYFLMQWGQFLDHDLDIGPESPDGEVCADDCDTTSPQCFNIAIPAGDPQFGSGQTDSTFRRDCIPLVRSAPTDHQCEGTLLPREQFNEITSYIDASNVYGSDDGRAEELRTLSNGLLRTFPVDGEDYLPLDFGCQNECPCSGTFPLCWLGGDIRSPEQTFLTITHTMWVREHNRIVRVLKKLNPSWNDERLYQEGRKIVGALHQKIVFSEYARELLGQFVFELIIPKYRGYDESVNAGIFNEFATAAYRMGHSQLRNELARIDDSYTLINAITFRQSFFQPGRIVVDAEGNFDNYVRGLLDRQSQFIDRFISGELTGHLFEPVDKYGNPSGPGLDLASLNIQRGRDHGLRRYVDYRTFAVLRLCYMGVPLPNPIMTPANVQLVEDVYGSFELCDLWVCGLLEEQLELGLPATQRTGGQLGPTFSVIVAEQFTRVRDGDRFFYQSHGVFSEKQVAAIEKVTLAAVICATSKISNVQPWAFRWPVNGNERISCGEIKSHHCLDLSPWQGQSFLIVLVLYVT